MRISTVCIFVMLAYTLSATAQPGGKWTTYANGNYIKKVATQGHYIWCGTWGGVVRWDTRDMSYIQYTTQDGLIDNNVDNIAVSPEGTVWASTGLGVSFFREGKWETISLPDNLMENGGPDIAFGPNGAVWFAHNRTVSRFESGSVTSYSLQEVKPFCSALAIAVSPDGTVWVGTSSGVLHYRDEVWEKEGPELIITHLVAAPDGSVWCTTLQAVIYRFKDGQWTDFSAESGLGGTSLAVDRNGRICVGGGIHASSANSGIYRYTGTSWETVVSHQGEDTVYYNSFTFDEEGKLWLCSYSRGLFRWDGVERTNYLSRCLLPLNSIKSVAVEPNGTVWVGTGRLINRFDGISWETFDGYGKQSPFYSDLEVYSPYNEINSIAVTPTGDIWFGMWWGAARLRKSSWTLFNQEIGSKSYFVSSIAAGLGDTLWFGTGNGAARFAKGSWKIYSASDGLADTNIRAIAAGPSGEVWAAAYWKNTVFRFNGNRWVDFSAIPGLADTTIHDVTITPDGTAWFATPVGIKRFDGNQCTLITTKDGLPDNWVLCIETAPDGSVWIGTWKGAARFDGRTWRTYTIADGLADNDVEAMNFADDGTVWFGTGNGLSKFVPDSVTPVLEQGIQPSPFVITGNFPNPFNPSTVITFTLPAPGRASLVIYSITGQKVRELISSHLPAGKHTVRWDGMDSSGKAVSSGIYFSLLKAGGRTATGKMALVR